MPEEKLTPAQIKQREEAYARAKDMSEDERFALFKEQAVNVLSKQPDDIVREASFAKDLDADSLDLVELVMALEEAFGITVDEAELEGIETIGQAYNLVTSKL